MAWHKERAHPHGCQSIIWVEWSFFTANYISSLLPLKLNLLLRLQIAYLNEYHMICREKVGPLLKAQGETEGLAWLMKETEPLG